MPTRYDLDRDALAELLAGEPRYRVDQVWEGLYRQLAEPAELTTLPKALRARLDDELPAGPRARSPSRRTPRATPSSGCSSWTAAPGSRPC